MSSEETPLLAHTVELDHDEVYNRFDLWQKRIIVIIVSWAGLVPFFLFSSFIPSVPQVAHELNTTNSFISLSISFSTFAAAAGCLTWGANSGYYGRRPVYLLSTLCIMLGSLGVAFSMTVPQLLFWRFVQSFGAGAGLSVGIAVISDVFKVEERGTAMGISMAAQLIGPAIGPVCGGLATHYASWRVMQYVFAIASTASFLLILALFPETSHPNTLGIDKAASEGRRQLRIINPTRSLRLLQSPILLIICAIGAITLVTDFALWVPLPFTVGERYGIHNEAWVGACFLPSGLGSIIGAPIAGRISDNIVKRKREKGDGVWAPENRLRGTELGSLFLVPLSLLLSGFATRYVDGNLGITLSLVALFMNGCGIVFVLTPCATYMVDILHAHSAEVAAAEDGFRALLLSIITTAIVPSINTIGVLPTDILTAIFALVAYGLLRFLIHYGARLRAWKDVGYSTANNN